MSPLRSLMKECVLLLFQSKTEVSKICATACMMKQTIKCLRERGLKGDSIEII